MRSFHYVKYRVVKCEDRYWVQGLRDNEWVDVAGAFKNPGVALTAAKSWAFARGTAQSPAPPEKEVVWTEEDQEVIAS